MATHSPRPVCQSGGLAAYDAYDGRMNLSRRAGGTAAQIPKAQRPDHHPGAKDYFNTAALQADAGPLWVCEGAFDAPAHQRRVSLALSIRVVEGSPCKSLSIVPLMWWE